MSTNTRVTGLLKKIGLSDRLVESFDQKIQSQIDYTVVNQEIDEFRTKSLNFLSDALSYGDELVNVKDFRN